MKEKVRIFLKEFKEKMLFWDILFRDDRGKNLNTLIELELRPIERKVIIESLDTCDYTKGPIEDKLCGGADMWVFGKTYKEQEIYIKITMGKFGNSVICISFHIAEHEMKYPLK